MIYIVYYRFPSFFLNIMWLKNVRLIINLIILCCDKMIIYYNICVWFYKIKISCWGKLTTITHAWSIINLWCDYNLLRSFLHVADIMIISSYQGAKNAGKAGRYFWSAFKNQKNIFYFMNNTYMYLSLILSIIFIH